MSRSTGVWLVVLGLAVAGTVAGVVYDDEEKKKCEAAGGTWNGIFKGCVCPAGTTMTNGKCVAGGGGTSTLQQNCINSGGSWNSSTGKCTCPQGYVLNSSGRCVLVTPTPTPTPTPTQQPPTYAPSVSPGSSTQTSVTLNYGQVSGATGYEYNDTAYGDQRIPGYQGAFHLTGLSPGQTIQARVRAYNSAGNGPWSGYITLTTQLAPVQVQIPPAPHAYACGSPVSEGNGNWTVPICWNPVEGYNVTGYMVHNQYYGNTFPVPATKNEADLTGVAPGITMTVYIAAVNAAGQSAWSNPVTVTTPAPSSGGGQQTQIGSITARDCTGYSTPSGCIGCCWTWQNMPTNAYVQIEHIDSNTGAYLGSLSGMIPGNRGNWQVCGLYPGATETWAVIGYDPTGTTVLTASNIVQSVAQD